MKRTYTALFILFLLNILLIGGLPGKTFASSCTTYSFNPPDNLTVSAQGGTGAGSGYFSFAVGGNCTDWVAVSDSSWITIVTQDPIADSVTYDVAINVGPARDGSITVDGTQIFAIHQDAGNGVTGTVTDGSTGLPLPAINIQTYATDGSFVAMTSTDANGIYSQLLPVGNYKFDYYSSSTPYVEQWYDSAADFSHAATVSVTGPVTLNNVVMTPGGSISGNVSDSLGPLVSMRVDAVDPVTYNTISSTYTDVSGNYIISGLAVGNSYDIYFNGNSSYAGQWYNNVSNVGSAVPVAVGTSGINAILTATGTISGTVTDSSLMGIGGISVGAFDPVTGNGVASTVTVFTPSPGSYTLTGLPVGNSYYIYFWGNSSYPGQWYPGAVNMSGAALVAVGQTGVNAMLLDSGAISGTVTDGTNPIENIWVFACDVNGCNYGGSTDASGSYTITGIPSGSYSVGFQGDYLGYTNQSLAAPVTVSAPAATTGIDAVLVLGGTISGNVRASATGLPLNNVSVTATCTVTGATYSASTDANGNYTIAGVPAGNYNVLYDSSGVYLTQYFSGAADVSGATAVTVNVGAIAQNVNASLVQPGAITGTVMEMDGTTPISGIMVSLYDTAGTYLNLATSTDASGIYTFNNLQPGSYKVFFSGGTVYVDQWYDNKSDSATADSVTVTEGATTTNNNTKLIKFGSISGVVTDGTNPVSGLNVEIYDAVSGTFVTFGVTAAITGAYSVPYLAPGAYKVLVNGGVTYVSQWYNNKPDSVTANPVTVSAGTDTPNISATVISTSTPGTISGTVTNGTSSVSNVQVSAWDTVSGSRVASAVTDAAGFYTLSMPAGNYKIEFWDLSDVYAVQWYSNALDINTATSITISPGSSATMNATLLLGATISGTVTDGTGPLSGIYVGASSITYPGIGASVTTDASGNYIIPNLPLGDYTVEFLDVSGTYASQWYNNAPDQSTAATLTLPAGNTPNINAALFPANTGSISGTVTYAGSGVTGLTVNVLNAGTNTVVATGITDPSGNYLIQGIPVGIIFPVGYNVQFLGGSNGYSYADLFYSNTPFQPYASLVYVSSGMTSSGIDAAMVLAGGLTGTVTYNGSPVTNMQVSAFDATNGLGWTVPTDASGKYTFSNLPTGSYKVLFQGHDLGYVDQWYNARQDANTADMVSITPGVVTSGVDAALALAGSVSGTVTDGTNPVANVWVYLIGSGSGFILSPSQSAQTDAAGHYSIVGIQPGSYTVNFDGFALGYAGQWYNNKLDPSAANPITVTAGVDTTNIDAILVKGGSISGTVTDGTNPLSGVYVTAYYADTGNSVTAVQTDASGNYTITNLGPANYKIYFQDCQFSFFTLSCGSTPPGYLPNWYGNTSDISTATAVAVNPGADTPNVNGVIFPAGGISGTVTDGTNPLPNIGVQAFDARTGMYITSTSADSSGFYTIGQLQTGSYKLFFSGNSTGYINAWYGNTPDMVTATAVGAAVGAITPNVDMVLTLGGTISGTVTDSAGAGLTGVSVNIIDASTGNYVNVNWGSTDSSGHYAIVGIPDGIYKVQFNGSSGYICTTSSFFPICSGSPTTGYSDIWYDTASDSTTATAVTIAQHSTVSNVNALLSQAGGISGTVTNSVGRGISGVTVEIYDPSTNNSVTTSTDSLGNYTAAGLKTGSYKVFFSTYGSSNYLSQWYPAAADQASAAMVNVTSGSLTTGINTVLAPGGIITGRITDGTSGIANVEIEVYDAAMNMIGSGFSDSLGNYSVMALPTGGYYVQFYGVQGHVGTTYGYISEWFDNSPDNAGAKAVAVTAGSTTSGIDAVLSVGGSISGHVTDGTNPVYGEYVEVHDAVSGNLVATGNSNYMGNYTVGGLPTGSYKVYFNGVFFLFFYGLNNYLPEWYDGASDAGTATSVAVTAPSMTKGIDATLVHTGTQFGIVATAGTGGTISPSGAVSVTGGSNQAFAITANSNFQISSLKVDRVDVTAAAGQTSFSYNFANVIGNHTIDAQFAAITSTPTSFSIDASAGQGGSITPSGSVTVTAGTDQAFTISPDSGYQIADVLVDGFSVGAVTSYTFTGVSSTHTIVATFRLVCSFTISPLDHDPANLDLTGGSWSFTVTASDSSCKWTAVSSDTRWLTTDSSGTGTATGTYTAASNSGSTRSATITVGGSSLTVTQHGECALTFTPESQNILAEGGTFTIEVAASSPNCAWTAATTDSWITELSGSGPGNGTVTYSVLSNEGIGRKGSITIGGQTFSIQQRGTLAGFGITLGYGGSIFPSGLVSASMGSTQTFYIIPDPGYVVTDVLVDGTSIGAVNTVTFINLREDHNISVNFGL